MSRLSIRIKIGGRAYQAHRLAWLYQTGEWPDGELDHASVSKDDNRWDNLRRATRPMNEANKPVRINNTSGFKGVSWDKRGSKWVGWIKVHGKSINLGGFNQLHLAYIAYCIAAREYFGEFARCYDAEMLIIPKKTFEERVLRNLLIATQPQFERAA